VKPRAQGKKKKEIDSQVRKKKVNLKEVSERKRRGKDHFVGKGAESRLGWWTTPSLENRLGPMVKEQKYQNHEEVDRPRTRTSRGGRRGEQNL